ncbi:MAG: CPBP family intramembrane glutamic endopeptidase [Opitutales bacterium]
MGPEHTLSPSALEAAIACVLLGASLALWIRRLRRDEAPDADSDREVPPWRLNWVDFGILVCGIIGAIVLLQILVAPAIPSEWSSPDSGKRPWLAVIGLLLFHVPMFGVYYYARRLYPHLFGGNPNVRPLALLNAMRGALTQFLLYLPLVWLAAFLWSVLLSVLHHAGLIKDPEPQDLVSLFVSGGHPVAIALLVLFAIALAPVVEEIIFRGGLYRFLKSQTPRGTAQVLSGGFFALIHGNLLSFFPLFVLGVLLARVYETYGNLLVPIFFHAYFNSLTLITLFLLHQSGHNLQ